MPSARSALVVGVLVACAAAFLPASASAAQTGTPSGTLPTGATLAPVCAGQFATLGCDADRIVTSHSSAKTAFSSATPVGWGATDLAKAHQLPTFIANHDTIGIIDVGADPVLESDLGVYRSQYGLPACTVANGCFRQMDFHGGAALAPGTTDTDKEIDEEIAAETSLDVDMASAACPHCNILEVQIPDSEVPTEPTDPSQPIDFDDYAQAFGTAVQTAIAHGANSISMSYGIPGDAAMQTGTIAGDLNHKGVAITASSGDGGFAGNGWVWPQALPTVTAVGGTELVEESGLFAEGAWSFAGSSCAPGTPALGQPASVTALCGGGRSSADISAVSDNIAVYDSYTPASGLKLGWQVLAGTSASSPFIAGVYALSGNLAAVHGPNTLYQTPEFAFHDVTSGANAEVSDSTGDCIPVEGVITGDNTTFANRLCSAQRGWDGPTGLGTPQGLTGF